MELIVHFDHALDRVCQCTTSQSATAAALLDLLCGEVATERLASLNVAFVSAACACLSLSASTLVRLLNIATVDQKGIRSEKKLVGM